MFYENLSVMDREVTEALLQELNRQNDNIELIASENFVPESIMEAMGSAFTNKYAEGYQRRDTSGFLEKLTRVQDGLVKAFVLLEMALRRGNGCESAVNRCLQEGDDLGKMVYRLKKALEEGREEGGERGRDKGTASGQQSRSNGPARA